MGQDTAGMPSQRPDEIIFFRRKMYFLAGYGYAAACEIDMQIERSEIRLRGKTHFAAPESRPQPCEEFANSEWFIDEIIGAEVESGDLFRFEITRRQDHNGDVGPISNSCDNLLTVHIRQAKVQNNCVTAFSR